jgi:hypothetical protein
MIAPVPIDRVRYTLSHISEPSVTIKEIKNWSDDEKEYARNTDYDGIVAKYSNSLEFVEEGMRFIVFIDDTYGINADIFLRKEEMHPRTDAWHQVYSGYLDLSTLEKNENSVTVQLSSGGLEQLVKARESEQVEIDRLTTLDGATLPFPTTVPVQMDGRKIFLLSKMEQTDKNLIQYTNISTKLVPPLSVAIRSDERIIQTFENTIEDFALIMDPSGDPFYPEPQQFFYEKSDRYKVLNLEFDLEFGIQIYPGGSIQWPDVYLEIRKYFYEDGVGYTLTGDYLIHKWVGTPRIGLQTLTLNTINNPYPIEVEKDESLMFIIWRDSPFANTKYKAEKTEIIITENSFFEPTKCNMMLAHDLGSRLARIITNKDCFYSQATGRIGLNDYSSFGFAEATGFANGLAIREFFKDETDEQNKYKPLTTSFRDFVDAMRVSHNLSIGIERINKYERLRMEEKSYFFNPQVTIKLPNQVSNLNRKPAKEYYYSGIELGYEKGGKYEESMGLDEYNGKSTFTTVITRIKNVFKAISPYRTDSYGAEFARRKTRKYYPSEDTRYDQDIFQFDLKRMILSMNIRKWQDDFEQEPTGVYSPETAYNLRYSPANIMIKHGWLLASSFLKYPFDYIRYGSSTANSNLTTKLIGGVEVSENGNENGIIIQNKDLPKAKFIPEWIEFQHICDFDIMQQVEGFTTVLGKKIPNFYGLVEFKNENNDIERGYLFNLKPNGSGQWQILKSNR